MTNQELCTDPNGLWVPRCRCVATSLVDVSKNLARVLLANPSMFMVPRKLVFRVLIGLYLHPCFTVLAFETPLFMKPPFVTG